LAFELVNEMSAYVYLPFAKGMTISVFGTTNQSLAGEVELVPPHSTSLKERHITSSFVLWLAPVALGAILGWQSGSQLSAVAMDTAFVLKERGQKNGHNRLFSRVPGSYGVALSY
jgi:hypothetical protein